MPDYRVFTILKTGFISGPSVFVTCNDDDAMIEKARQMLEGADVEVWDGPRRVIQLKSPEA
jgi:hypothetical protein